MLCAIARRTPRRGSTLPSAGPAAAMARAPGDVDAPLAAGAKFVVAEMLAYCSTSSRVISPARPLPWIAAELGWFVAEYGRQPWAIDGVLPTFLAVSSLSVAQVVFTLTGFVLFYSALLVIDVTLMRKYIVMGPPAALGLLPPSANPAAVPAE